MNCGILLNILIIQHILLTNRFYLFILIFFLLLTRFFTTKVDTSQVISVFKEAACTSSAQPTGVIVSYVMRDEIVTETDCCKQTIVRLALRKVVRISTKAVGWESKVKFISFVKPLHLLIGEGDLKGLG